MYLNIFCSCPVQALECDLITELLSMLEGRGSGVGLEGGSVARVVGALKAMSRAGLHSERVKNILARSPVWEHYAAQRHDLFISAPQHHSITGIQYMSSCIIFHATRADPVLTRLNCASGLSTQSLIKFTYLEDSR